MTASHALNGFGRNTGFSGRRTSLIAAPSSSRPGRAEGEGLHRALVVVLLGADCGHGTSPCASGTFPHSRAAGTGCQSHVRVSGTAAEFQHQTQVLASAIVARGAGSVEPVDVTLPFPSATYHERYEGILVRLPQHLAASRTLGASVALLVYEPASTT